LLGGRGDSLAFLQVVAPWLTRSSVALLQSQYYFLLKQLYKRRRYHSHPFDLGDHSHCFLSQTDLSTQLQWQRAEDPHGNPFVAIVVDPLRSAHFGEPELKAFRAFPPEYQSPVPNECPDGKVENSERLRLEHWGSCWNRYYELGIEYYMSSTSRRVLEQLTQGRQIRYCAGRTGSVILFIFVR